MGCDILYVDNRVKYVMSHRIPWLEAAQENGFNVHVTTLTAGDGSRIEEAGFPYHSISGHRRSNNPLKEVRLIAQLYALYQKLKPKIIHHITLRSILYGSIASLPFGDTRIVNGVTGLGYLFSARSFRVRIFRKSVLWALRLLTRSNHTYLFQNPDDRRLFQEHHVAEPSSSVVIRGSGVDVDHFDQRPEQEGTPPVVLFPARMLWHKGVQEFVEAARILKSSGVEARFVLVGDTDSDNPGSVSSTQLEKWEAEGIVEWWGYQEDMPDVFAQSHVVCLPSKYREGVPKALIEAASSGRPIVTTDMPGCREIVENQRNGYLVPPGDAKATAEAVARLVTEPNRRIEMGRKGRELVQEKFSIDQVVKKTIEVYKEILST